MDKSNNFEFKSNKPEAVLEMAKDICSFKIVCNDVCNPLDSCAAYRYAKRAVEAGYVKVVMCKDCAHWGGVTYGFICRKFSGIETKICMGADCFCNYGERKGAE